jgi:drug/metabolite transporter (DMT)-like permease
LSYTSARQSRPPDREWNRTLQALSAVQSSLINSTTMIPIAVLAWIFLGERLTWAQGIGVGLEVQLGRTW